MKGISDFDYSRSQEVDELEKARNEAEAEAFNFIRDTEISSNLESLDQVKQIALNKHQNKIAFLKASVQGIVSNIEAGINDLVSTEEALKDLREEIINIQDETAKQKLVFSEHNKDLHDLALIWERATTIDELLYKFENADETIDQIVDIFQNNPGFFSIKAFNSIKSLLAFRNELLEKVEEPSLKQFVEEHFKPIEECSTQLDKNVAECLQNAFTQTQDELIRAIWITKASGQDTETIRNHIFQAILLEAGKEIGVVNIDNIAEYLSKISAMMDSLPEKMNHLYPVLPEDINTDQLIKDFIDNVVLSKLTNYRDQMEPSTHLYNSLLECSQELISAQRTLLGIEPSSDYIQFVRDIKQCYQGVLFGDLNRFLANIVKLDSDFDSIQSKQKGIYFTQAPIDCMDAFLHCYQVAMKANDIKFDTLVIDIVDKLCATFEQLGQNAINSYEKKYIIATCNNSMDAVTRINEFAKNNITTIVEEYRIEINNRDRTDINQQEAKSRFTRELQKPWNDIKNKCLVSLFQIVLSRIISQDSDFRINFNEKLDNIQSELQGLSANLYQPLYKKFLSIFIRLLIPHYIQSYFDFDKLKSQEDFENIVSQEVDALVDLFNRLAPGLCKKSVDVLIQFKGFMTEPFDVVHECFHIIAKEYTDFAPAYAHNLLKIRPDHKDSSADFKACLSSMETMYKNVEVKNEENFNMEYAKNRLSLKLKS